MNRSVCILGGLLVSGAAAVRQPRQGENGLVDFVYSFGAPGGSSPPLMNTRGEDPCFPGLRVWLTSPATFGEKWCDFVAPITIPVGYSHSVMDAEDITEDKPSENGYIECTEAVAGLPKTRKPSTRLHGGFEYIKQAEGKLEPLLSNFTFFARTGKMKEPELLTEEARTYGWRMVGYNWGSHLLQNPNTLDCVVTFRGTDGAQEWLGNLATVPVAFCGLSNPDDQCRRAPCQTSKARGSFTHKGFTDRLRSIVQDDDWQNNIRTHLPSCKKLYVAGHSAGGAMSELFQACLSNAPQSGEFGFDDYKFMSFVKGTPATLPYL